MLYVIGIGPGNKGCTTEISRELIEKADCIIGGKRNIESMGISGKAVFFIGADLDAMKEFILTNREKNIAVLASGDPSLYGIGAYIMRELKDETEIEIVPGISSIQYCFSRFRIDMNDVYITSSHGREPDFDFIFMHDKIAMVTDRKIGPYEIGEEIGKRKLDYTIYVGERLSYDDEVLTYGNFEKIMERADYKMAVVILIRNK